MDHIELAKWGELLLVAPASAGVVARLAHGIAEDLVGTVALAIDAKTPRILCPAMNPTMLESRPVQRNLVTLREDGWEILEPESGHMACGDEGQGRLVEPQRIVERVAARLAH
jgi:phosphopantothenoylcysteine decarboxylase/phosphopantothenate--cysteine ligase